jgi:hypothetical protein
MKPKGSGPKRHGRHPHAKLALNPRPAPGKSARRQHPTRFAAARVPKTCPMCGAPVTDLKRHIHERHDDPHSHPHD